MTMIAGRETLSEEEIENYIKFIETQLTTSTNKDELRMCSILVRLKHGQFQILQRNINETEETEYDNQQKKAQFSSAKMIRTVQSATTKIVDHILATSYYMPFH